MTKFKNELLIQPDLIKELLAQAQGQELFGQNGFFQHLKRGLIDGMLEGEITHHLGYQKHAKTAKDTGNRRNGHYQKKVISGDDILELNIPRDREGVFDPQLIPKGVRRLGDFDDKVISLPDSPLYSDIVSV